MMIVDLIIVALLAVMVVLVVQKLRGRRPDAMAVDAETVRLTDEVRELRARVHVLERVITENRSSVDLQGEIDRLRDR